MTEKATLELVAFDTTDVRRLAAFYRDLVGGEFVREVDDWITLRLPDGNEIGFQQVPSHVPPQWPGQEQPQQFHLDLFVEGREAAAERAVGHGATRLADGATWITLADPSGHPFDLCEKDGLGSAIELFAITIDAPEASALGHFYADLLGMEVTYEGPEGALVAGGGKSLMFQQVGEYTAPRWPDPAHPQQAHLDVLVDDLDAAQARALGLGATLLDGEGEQFRTLADPAGHPFDLSL